METYFPRRDTPSSQERFQATQFRHGRISVTLHRTRRALQAKHAFFARMRGRSGVAVAIVTDNIGCFLQRLDAIHAYITEGQASCARVARLYTPTGRWRVGRFGYFGCMPQAGKFPHAEPLPPRRTIVLTLK